MKELICIVCPKGCHLKIDEANNNTITGNTCEKGAQYGRDELLHPVRMVTSTVRAKGGLLPRCPVKTSRPIPKDKIFDAMKLLDALEVVCPVECGQILLKNILGTGADFVTARSL